MKAFVPEQTVIENVFDLKIKCSFNLETSNSKKLLRISPTTSKTARSTKPRKPDLTTRPTTKTKTELTTLKSTTLTTTSTTTLSSEGKEK